MNAKLIWAAVGLLVGSLGYQMLTPNSRLAKVEAQTTTLTWRVDTLNHNMETVTRTVRALGRKACYESTPAQRALWDFPCAQLVTEQ